VHDSNVKWWHLQLDAAFTVLQFIYFLSLPMNALLVLKHKLRIKEMSRTVLKIVYHAFEWYTVSLLFCTIYIISIALFSNASTFHFLFCMLLHFPCL
jgi:hypothetical protein